MELKKARSLYYSLNYHFFQIGYYCCIIMLIGTLCNFLPVQGNAGLMPVHYEYNWTDSKHFSFQNFSEVKHPYLTDIIPLPFNAGFFSIGDVLILLPLIFLFEIIITFFYLKFRYKLRFQTKTKVIWR